MSIIDGMLLNANYHQLTKYNRFKTIITSYKLLLSHLMPSSLSFPPPPLFSISKPPPSIDPYLTPPRPPINPYLARSFASELPPQVEGVGGAGLGGWKLMRALLHAKVEAERRLGEYLAEVELGDGGEGVRMLLKKRA